MAEGIGSGYRECGIKSSIQHVANQTIKNNSECAEIIAQEFKKHATNKVKLKRALKKGWNDQILCLVGNLKEGTDIYTVSTITKLWI